MSLVTRHFRVRFLERVCLLGAAMFLSMAVPARASEQEQSIPTSTSTPSTSSTPEPTATDKTAPDQNTSTDPVADPTADSKNRIFGVMPNYTAVEGVSKAAPVTTAQSFKMAALDSFDPFVYPLFGFVAGTAQVQHE